MYIMPNQRKQEIELIIISSDSEDEMSDSDSTSGETMEYSMGSDSEHTDSSIESDSEHTDSDISILGSDDYMSETEDGASDVPMTDLEPDYVSSMETDYEPILSDSYFSDSESEEIFDNIIKKKELKYLKVDKKFKPKNTKRISKPTQFFENEIFIKDKTDYHYDPYKRNNGDSVLNFSKHLHNKSSKR